MTDTAVFLRARTVIARAFENDPLLRWVFPDQADRLERTAAWLGRVAEGYAQHGVIAVDDPQRPAAVAVYSMPDVPDADEVLPSMRELTRLLAGAERAPDLAAAFRELHERGPHEPALHLQFLAVDPEAQGAGKGSAMLRHVTEVADSRRVPIRLETMTERNVTLYRAHGFEIADEFYLGTDGPQSWIMLRPVGGARL